MPRFEPRAPAELTREQRRVGDAIASTRAGNVGGPFSVWLTSVAIAERAAQLGDALRVSGSLDPPLFELAVLVVARFWSADYEWAIHAEAAQSLGLDAEVIEAIRLQQTPSFARADEQVVYELTSELLSAHEVSEATYARALSALGLELLVELVAVVGFYTMAALTLVAFEVEPPRGRGLGAETSTSRSEG